MRVPSAEVQNPMLWLSFIAKGYRSKAPCDRPASEPPRGKRRKSLAVGPPVGDEVADQPRGDGGKRQPETMPLEMFIGLREKLSPAITAAATLMMALSIVLLVVPNLLTRRGQGRRAASG